MKMKSKNSFLLGVVIVAVTSYVVFGKNSLEGEIEAKEDLVESGIEQVSTSEMDINSLGEKEFKITSRKSELQDANVSKDPSVPNSVGIDASKAEIKKGEFPSIPGFKKTESGISGKIPNESNTEVHLMDLGDRYELRMSSEVLYDKTVQMYAKQILEYYKDSKYTSEISGAVAIFTINKR